MKYDFSVARQNIVNKGAAIDAKRQEFGGAKESK
jgi:hypothetical protein